ncbi:dienelactone hydrolase family protein [Altererythrobacter sp. RZ02]|uniref:Dienelactone hydrolase family protein n=1 Tax=Pontixanthobacter rizhaonensis TaxID=2730337 RepID=A0A848QPW7_9SPHN|nr:dienelactone hydrolase family protein [Pontixanthobacter rizhaonensis]NMW32949.1 dienelactone hydrolase family protein [Pontixanthobacter rizhaonensis]
MCDEAAITRWAKEGLNRRQFGVLGGMAAVAACSPVAEGADDDTTLPAMSESSVSFETADGTMDAFFVAPDSGPYPAVILWPDIAGLREAKRNMARRLAGRGYAVLVLNPYYRDQAGQIWEDFADFAGNEGWPKAREMRKKHTPEAIMNDARAAVKWLDEQSGVDSSKGIGTQGYCMGGPLAMWTAAAVPGRVKAAASFHGGGLVIADDPMSPHTLIDGTEGHYLIAIAQNDDAKAPEEKDILSDVISRTGSGSKVEVYAGDHGWTVPDSPVYAEAPAEQAWADLLAVYQGAL